MSSEPNPSGSPYDRILRERDLYRNLLELGQREQVDPFLKEALALAVHVSGAKRGYIELIDDEAKDQGPRFWMAQGCYDAEVEEIRAALSRGVIEEAIASGKTVLTESALRDPRFLTRDSVRRNRIEAVLCAPIGTAPPIGVVYLQDRHQPGPFPEEDQRLVEIFAHRMASLAERLLSRQRLRNESDPTLPARRKLLGAERLIGRSPALAKVLNQVALIAPLDISVLLTGPTGTGKTQIARVLHDNSLRRNGPFVEINCAALPESIAESELFGVKKGAFTDARENRVGKVAAAQGGTLFLDEVGDLPVMVQGKLLQLLQSREYYPLGSSELSRADVRVIAATNVDLKSAVASKRFREDLFYRLEVLPLRIPSLAERLEDIPELAEYLCERACEAHRFKRKRLSPTALRAIQIREWPGNIRELENEIQRAVISASREPGIQVERHHLFTHEAKSPVEYVPRSFQEATERFQKQLLHNTLEEVNWKITEAANRLELSRTHIYNLIEAFRLKRNKE